MRGEAYNQQGVQDRNRARIRVRLGLEGQLNQDFIGGLAIATGSHGRSHDDQRDPHQRL